MNTGTPLPLFPTPYPGECLYSVFCRYHVRSGNYTDRDTIGQLFGRYLELHSTLLSPYRLNYADRWYAHASGITRWKLMGGNTAYPYYSLFNWPWRKKSFLEVAAGCSTSPRTTALLSRDVSSKKYLCYCPDCAREDRRLYGEAYWHILPQLNGVEYCPRHKCPIIKSPVETSKTRRRLIPANHVLNNRPRVNPPHHDSLTLRNYLDLAEDSEWMFLNGTKLNYEEVNEKIAIDASSLTSSWWSRKPSLYNEHVLRQLQAEVRGGTSKQFRSDLMNLYKIKDPLLERWKFMLNCYVVRLVQIRCLYGSMKNLYQEIQEQRLLKS